MKKIGSSKFFVGDATLRVTTNPRRGEGSALPIRRGLAATRLETSSRRCRRVPAALSGFFAAPGHETPPSRHTKFHEKKAVWREARTGVFVCGEGSFSCPAARGGAARRDAIRRTGRDEVSGPGAAYRIKVAKQPASPADGVRGRA